MVENYEVFTGRKLIIDALVLIFVVNIAKTPS